MNDQHIGDMYTFSTHIPVEINSAKITNPLGWDSVMGCQPHARELSQLVNLWVPQKQMMQVAPGHRWCSVCGDARPNSYFDVEARDEDGMPLTYAKACRQCVNAHDPTLAKEKYCSSCKIMHPRGEFVDDMRYTDKKFPSCKDAKRRYDAANHARKIWLEEGHEPVAWGGRRERAMA